MPYCPKCGYEYLPEVRQCPDCGEQLAARPPVAPGDSPHADEPLAPVYEAPDEVMLVMVRAVLEENCIPSVAQSGRVPWYDDVRFTAGGYHSRVLVFESQAGEARRIIAEYLRDVRTGEAEREALEEEAESENP